MRRFFRARSGILSFCSPILFALGLAGCSASPRSSSATEEAWNPGNDPSLFGVQSQSVFSLPVHAELSAKTPWNGYWWPTYKGGVSLRWQSDPNSSTYRDYMYAIPTPAELAAMSAADLAKLSPAEKYDLYTGHTDLPLTHAQRQQTLADVDVVNGEVPDWHGICHGLAAAATNETQPGSSATVQLADGRALVFYYSDLEALLDQTYADTSRYNAKFEGARCYEDPVRRDPTGRPINPDCRDVNAGTMHLVLSSYIGQRGQPFIGDMSPDTEVWNYAIAGYTMTLGQKRAFDASDPLHADRAPGTVSLLDVDVSIATAGGADPSLHPAAPTQLAQAFSYTLELDANDKILGGEWRGENHPDFLWQATSNPSDAGGVLPAYSQVKALVAKSLTGS